MSNSFFAPVSNLVKSTHPYRLMLGIIDFNMFTRYVEDIKLPSTSKDSPGDGRTYNRLSIFKCLLLQYMEDLSDRELERYIAENTAAKFFCGFELEDKTPDHTFFSKFRKAMGTDRMGKCFKLFGTQLKRNGVIKEIFTFVDSSKLISKQHTWNERDKLIAKGEVEFNNSTIHKVARDKQARFGSKGKKKFWYGYKTHVGVDTQTGFIMKIAVTPANILDHQGLKHVLPYQGAILADKGYCPHEAQLEIQKRRCHSMVIKKNNMKTKNKDLDTWITKLRSPDERVFSKLSNVAKYIGVAKNQFQKFGEALALNIKRLLRIQPDLAPIDWGLTG